MVNGRILRNKNASFLLVSPAINHLFFLLFGIFYGIMENEKKKLPIGIENFEEIQSAGFYYPLFKS